jgi:hypothetical protein
VGRDRGPTLATREEGVGWVGIEVSYTVPVKMPTRWWGSRGTFTTDQGRRCDCDNHSDRVNGEGNAAVGGEDGGDGRVRGGGSPYLRRRRDAGRRGTGGGVLGADRRSVGFGGGGGALRGGRTLVKWAGASNRSELSAASAGPWAVGFLPKRFAQKSRENFAVWFQLQLLVARSRPEVEPNRGHDSWFI